MRLNRFHILASTRQKSHKKLSSMNIMYELITSNASFLAHCFPFLNIVSFGIRTFTTKLGEWCTVSNIIVIMNDFYRTAVNALCVNAKYIFRKYFSYDGSKI